MKITPQSFTQQKYGSFHPLRRFLIRRFLVKVFAEIRKTNPKSILDIGCGEGLADKFFLGRNPLLKIVGVDVDSEALKKAKINCPQIKTKKGNIYQLPFNKNSFDLVLCLEVLEHLKSPQKALREIKRVSRKQIIISVPNEPFFSWASFFSGRYLKSLGRHPEHIHFWSKKEFKKLLRGYFGKVRVETCFPWLIGIGEP